ncbi:MAG: peptidoglycan editing factor PgeF [Lysobacterales bacterium]
MPDWPAPDWVTAFSTTRGGGVSEGAYASLNLGFTAGDVPGHVAHNRQLALADCSAVATWLKQVHGSDIIELKGQPITQVKADGAWTALAGQLCLVQTADCLPVLVCDVTQRRIAAVHAGWRGLAGGVLEAALSAMQASADTTLIWLGPAIGPRHFEVGSDVVEAFCQQHSMDKTLFEQTDSNHWLADLPGLAQRRLQRLGFHQIFASNLCTYSDAQRFFSYRRDGVTGRMVSAISIAPTA